MKDTKLSNEQVENIVRVIIDGKTYLAKQDDGSYTGEICADYQDKLDTDSIKKIAQSDSPMETFIECFDTIDVEDAERDQVLKEIERHWDEDNNGLFGTCEDFIADWLRENVYFNFPYDHFLKQNVLVNIIVNTGDGDTDYTCNNFVPFCYESQETIDNRSALLWLVKQQGYKKSQLNKAVRKQEFGDSKLLKSVYTECLNVTTHMNALAFFVKMTLKQFIELRENPINIKLSKDTSCGLYDCWNGSGGTLELELENDVVIPKKYVEMHIDGTRGYGVDNIYGMSSSFWSDTVLAA